MGEHGGVTADPSCNNMGNMSHTKYIDTAAEVGLNLVLLTKIHIKCK